MTPKFERTRWESPASHPTAKAARRRPGRSFRPQPVTGLEGRALLSTAAGAASATALAAPLVASSANPTWDLTRNIRFPTVDGRSERLDVYTPETPPPPGGYPVMIAIHGGGWRAFEKGPFGLRNAEAFTQAGYVVVAPNYVLSRPGDPTWPQNFEDVQAAVRWVHSNAATMDFDPTEVVAEGESAGANLAALLGVDSPQDRVDGSSSAVDAVVAISTPTDLTALYQEKALGAPDAAQFLGGSPDQVPANYIAASPIDHVAPGDPPMLLIQGDQDAVIPMSQSEDMHAALSAAGVSNDLILVDGGHGLDFPTHYATLVPAVLQFLDAVWKGQ